MPSKPEIRNDEAITVNWHWPSRAGLALAARLYLGLSLLFGLVYFGANWWALQRQGVATVHADWELDIPFIPGAIAVYFSIALVFVLPVFALDEQGLRRLARTFAICTCVAGLFFVAMPLRIAFERPASVPGFEAIYAALYRIDAPFNTAPSLHIAYSSLILWTLMAGTASRYGRLALGTWWLAICTSVLFVHQHHVVDVATGIVLGAACAWPLRFSCSGRA